MDEQQTEALRAALHRWIDQATGEHLERLDREVQAILADVDAPKEETTPRAVFVPVTHLSDEKEPPKMISVPIVRISAQEMERRREEADQRANEGRMKMFEKRDAERKEQVKRLLDSDT